MICFCGEQRHEMVGGSYKVNKTPSGRVLVQFDDAGGGEQVRLALTLEEAHELVSHINTIIDKIEAPIRKQQKREGKRFEVGG